MTAISSMEKPANPARPAGAPPEWIALVREKIESLRYGVVQLVVHDGRVTQIERTEKTRLEPKPGDRD